MRTTRGHGNGCFLRHRDTLVVTKYLGKLVSLIKFDLADDREKFRVQVLNFERLFNTRLGRGLTTQMQSNTFAEIVQGWIGRSFRTSPAFVRHRRHDGEFEASVRAPRGSKAGHLVVFTYRGDLWVRFSPPNMCYSVDNRGELASIVRQLLSERALFMVSYRNGAWSGTTLILKGTVPKLRRGEVAHVVSWTGRYDETISLPTTDGTRSMVAGVRPKKGLQPSVSRAKKSVISKGLAHSRRLKP
jgi:hypothetical protein